MRYTVKQPRMLLVYVLYMSIYDEGTFPLAQGTWFVLGLLSLKQTYPGKKVFFYFLNMLVKNPGSSISPIEGLC